MSNVDLGLQYLGVVLDGAFYGFHVAVFGLFIAVHRYRKTKFYHGAINIATIVMFTLCSIYVMGDIWQQFNGIAGVRPFQQNQLDLLISCLYSMIDFLAQMILLYRCYIIWNKKFYVVVLPGLVSLASLGTGLALFGMLVRDQIVDGNPEATPGLNIGIFSFAASMAVNTTTVVLIVVRIWTVSRNVRGATTGSFDKPYHLVIALLLESGLAIFLVQLVWLVMFLLENIGLDVVEGVVTQTYGITPTLLIVRVAMGASYDTHTMVSTGVAFVKDSSGNKSKSGGTELTLMANSVGGNGTASGSVRSLDKHPRDLV